MHTKKAIPAIEQPKGPHFHFTALVTRRESRDVPISSGGTQSVGQFIDGYFGDVALEGGSVAEFGLDIHPEVFEQMYRPAPSDAAETY